MASKYGQTCFSVAQTLENTREADETAVAADDEEAAAEEAGDEFADHFGRVRQPMVLLTTCCRPSAVMYQFLTEMMQVSPFTGAALM